MKQIYLITVISLLFFSCSQDNDEIIKEEIKNPTVESISESNATVGDIVIVEGEDFNSNESYVIEFNGVEGIITEINVDFIKVEVPENATTGDITLIYNGETTVIGTLEIEPVIIEPIPESKLYAYKRGGSQSIVEINPEDGKEVATIAVLGDNYYKSWLFNEVTNELIGYYAIYEVTTVDPEIVVDTNNGKKKVAEAFLYKINIATGEITKLEMQPAIYEDFVITKEGKLYAYKRGDSQSIVEINTVNGSEVATIATLGDDYYSNLVFNEVTNEIIAHHSVVDIVVENDPNNGKSNPIEAFLYKINVSTGALIELEMQPFFYEDFVSTKEGKLYTYKRGDSQSIVEINPEDGSEVSTIATLGEEYYADLVYNEATNEIIGHYTIQNVPDPETIVDTTNGKRIVEQAFLYKINVTTGVITESEMQPNSYENLVIQND